MKIKFLSILLAVAVVISAIIPVFAAASGNAAGDGKTTEYNVIFYTNGGGRVAMQKVEQGGLAKRPADPIRRGFTFTGWYYRGSLFDFNNNRINKNILLTARWSPNPDPISGITAENGRITIQFNNNSALYDFTSGSFRVMWKKASGAYRLLRITGFEINGNKAYLYFERVEQTDKEQAYSVYVRFKEVFMPHSADLLIGVKSSSAPAPTPTPTPTRNRL